MDVPGLRALGWDRRVAAWVAGGSAGTPGRVVRVDLDSCLVATGTGQVRARHAVPVAVGDWARIEGGDSPAVMDVAPRWAQIARRDPSGLTQVLAANVDFVLIAAPADRLSLTRVEREVAIGWDGGATPVVLLTKADLDDGSTPGRLRDRLVGVNVVPVSVATGEGTRALRHLLQPSRTAVLLGPSGAGKSTLINRLLGREAAVTGPVREGDLRGRHTTTARELHVVPSGGVLIDTPGLRSLALTSDHGGVAAAFPDIEDLAAGCRFDDCSHDHEPDCAVLAAVSLGALDGARLANYRKLQRELDFQLRRDDPIAAREARAVWKARRKAARALYRERGR